MIPRLLHHIWVGPRPVPEEWLVAWRAMHPSWQHRLWREADLAKLAMPNRAAFDDFMARGVWHGAADIARVAILQAHGGVYVDIDAKPLRTFEGAPFMRAGFFAGYEPTPNLPGRIANGTIGSEPGHPILGTYARLVGEMDSLDEPWDTCGGTGLTAAVLVHRRCCKPLVLPAGTFYATDMHGAPVPGREISYAQHFWSTTNRTYPGRVVVLVPRRAGDPVRDRAWAWVRASWETLGWPIFEGHHNDGVWSAAVARNTAARLAGEWDVAVVIDADITMFDFEPVRQAVRIAAQSGTFVRPHQRCWMLDEPASDVLLRTGVVPTSGAELIRLPAVGGIVVIPRRLWDTVGGYDERFRGWGFEDTAIALACRSLGGERRIAGDIYHLWHEHSRDHDPAKPEHQAARALFRRYEAARRPAAMRALLAEREAAGWARAEDPRSRPAAMVLA